MQHTEVPIPNFLLQRFLNDDDLYFRFVDDAINSGRRTFTCREGRGMVYASDDGVDDTISIRLMGRGYINNGPSIKIHGLDGNYKKNEQYCTRKIKTAVEDYIFTARRERTSLIRVVTSKTGQRLPPRYLSTFF